MLFTPLHHAARKGFTEIAEYLLSQGVDVNIRRSLSPCSSFVFSSLSLSLDTNSGVALYARVLYVHLAVSYSL